MNSVFGDFLVKICLIAPSILETPPKYGGAIETFTYELGVSLSKLNNEVIILSRSNVTRKVRINPNLTIYFLHIPNNSLIRGVVYNVRIIIKLINQKSLDILHTQSTAIFPGVFLVSRLFGIPVVHTEHIVHPWIKTPFITLFKKIKFPFELFLGKFTAKRVGKIVVSNEFMKRALESIDSKLSLKFEIISQGINVKLFNLNLNKNLIRRKFNLLDTDKLILYVGRIVPEKNLEILFNSFIKLKIQYANLKLMLVGPESPKYQTDIRSKDISKYYLKLKSLVQGKNLQNSIIFTGSLPYHEMPYYYASSNLLVQPSPIETFGRAIFEAAAVGTPFIGSQIGKFPPKYLPKSSGIFLRKMDSENLSAAIETILNNENEFRINGIEEARKIHAQYNWENIAEFYLEVYKKLIKKKYKNRV